MAPTYEVKHPNPVIRELAMDYIAGIEEIVAFGYGRLDSGVVAHNHQVTERENAVSKKKRYAKAGGRS